MITHCICHKISFADILKLAKENHIDRLPALKQKLNICNKCRKCNPYVREVLKYGVTSFNTLK